MINAEFVNSIKTLAEKAQAPQTVETPDGCIRIYVAGKEHNVVQTPVPAVLDTVDTVEAFVAAMNSRASEVKFWTVGPEHAAAHGKPWPPNCRTTELVRLKLQASQQYESLLKSLWKLMRPAELVAQLECLDTHITDGVAKLAAIASMRFFQSAESQQSRDKTGRNTLGTTAAQAAAGQEHARLPESLSFHLRRYVNPGLRFTNSISVDVVVEPELGQVLLRPKTDELQEFQFASTKQVLGTIEAAVEAAGLGDKPHFAGYSQIGNGGGDAEDD